MQTELRFFSYRAAIELLSRTDFLGDIHRLRKLKKKSLDESQKVANAYDFSVNEFLGF